MASVKQGVKTQNPYETINGMDVTFGPTGQLAKVTAISDDRSKVFFDLRNGLTGSLESDYQDFFIGDVLLIPNDPDSQSVERIPTSAWPDEFWVGIVKIKLEDITVIESHGRFRTVSTTNDPNYSVGNTVQASEAQGVTRVLSTKPVKYIDLPNIDDEDIDRFRWNPSDSESLSFDDFGGLLPVVKRARELIEIPLQKQKELSNIGARPVKGVLFTGAPGTGKTLLARIIASQSGAVFYEISGPAIFSKWYGQSEDLLRKLFRKAEKDDQAIIFFDELDSVAAQRDDTSHEASKRVVAQLLTLMDGFVSSANIIVIAATNRPQDLDVALRRPGRFDWEIEFPFPNKLDREDILAKTACKHQTSITISHRVIAEQTRGWSAAELSAIWSEAALLAVGDQRCLIRDEDYIGGFERVAFQRERF